MHTHVEFDLDDRTSLRPSHVPVLGGVAASRTPWTPEEPSPLLEERGDAVSGDRERADGGQHGRCKTRLREKGKGTGAGGRSGGRRGGGEHRGSGPGRRRRGKGPRLADGGGGQRARWWQARWPTGEAVASEPGGGGRP